MKKKAPKFNLISWMLLLVASIVAIIVLPSFSVFPSNMFIPLIVGLIIVLVITLLLSLKSKGMGIINTVLAVALAASCVLMPNLESREENVFTEPAKTDVRNISFYVLNSDYRTANSDTFTSLLPSDNLEDYANAKFIVQSEFNQDDQNGAIEGLKTQLDVTSLNIVSVETVNDALKTFYNNEGDVLVLNEAFVSTIKTINKYSDFTTDTKVIYTYTIDESEPVATVEPETTSNSFVMYVAAHDESTTSFSLYGRTDVDMIIAVNPDLKQILMVSIPRDFYVENPALGYGLDKLTHLGNNGISNTLEGVNRLFGLDISTYILTDFDHFSAMIDSVGGITVNNPYAFSTFRGYSWDAGEVYLDGASALAFSRERYSLSNGDFGRNQHHGLVMEGLLNKIQELCNQGDYMTVINTLYSNFLTNMSLTDIYSIYSSSSHGDAWTYVKYHLGGQGTYDVTASYGSQQLYVCKPFTSQLDFTREQVNKVLNGEAIQEESLPDAAQTTFVEN